MTFGDVSPHRRHVATATGTNWPFEERLLAHAGTQALLEASANMMAIDAVTFHESTNHRELMQSAIAMGTGLELLAKAYLCSVHPAMSVERGDKDSLLMLLNKAEHAGADARATTIKTLGAHEALALAKRIAPPSALTWNPQTDGSVLQVRNAALHFALVDRKELKGAASSFVRLTNELLGLLQAKPETFWRDAKEVAAILANEASTARERAYEAAKLVAKADYMRMVSGLDDATRVVVLQTLSGRKRPDPDDNEWVGEQECPVCKQVGWLVGHIERGNLEVEIANFHDASFYVNRTAYPYYFNCPVCGLYLEDDELLESPFPGEVELEPDWDPPEHYEPDEDIWRDR